MTGVSVRPGGLPGFDRPENLVKEAQLLAHLRSAQNAETVQFVSLWAKYFKYLGQFVAWASRSGMDSDPYVQDIRARMSEAFRLGVQIGQPLQGIAIMNRAILEAEILIGNAQNQHFAPLTRHATVAHAGVHSVPQPSPSHAGVHSVPHAPSVPRPSPAAEPSPPPVPPPDDDFSATYNRLRSFLASHATPHSPPHEDTHVHAEEPPMFTTTSASRGVSPVASVPSSRSSSRAGRTSARHPSAAHVIGEARAARANMRAAMRGPAHGWRSDVPMTDSPEPPLVPKWPNRTRR
jgi:hypothetical protein